MARPIQMTKPTFLILMIFCVITLVFSITFYLKAKSKVIYACQDETAAEKTVIQSAKDSCVNGWQGILHMKDGNLAADCN